MGDEIITINFTTEELIPVLAEFYGYEEQEIEIPLDYSDEEIKQALLERY